jgi:hypothetical protein
MAAPNPKVRTLRVLDAQYELREKASSEHLSKCLLALATAELRRSEADAKCLRAVAALDAAKSKQGTTRAQVGWLQQAHAYIQRMRDELAACQSLLATATTALEAEHARVRAARLALAEIKAKREAVGKQLETLQRLAIKSAENAADDDANDRAARRSS